MRASGARSQGGRHAAQRWHTRGYLPHVDATDLWQSITYRLADALPRQALADLERSVASLPASERQRELRKRIDAWIDAGLGSCLLRTDAAAAIIWENWARFAGSRYDIGAWVIMPNHVHILIRIHPGGRLETIIRSWKSYTAKRLMTVLGIPAPIWLDAYWDRFIRDEAHWRNVVRYIEPNPVAAGLVSDAAVWPWSSASAHRDHAPLARTPPSS